MTHGGLADRHERPAADGVWAVLHKRLTSRTWRRRAVLGVSLGFPVVVGLFWLGGALAIRPWTGLLALVPGAALLVGMAALCSEAMGAFQLTSAPDPALDERQQHVRDYAYRVSYLVVASLYLLLVGYLAAADGHFGRWLPRGGGPIATLIVGTIVLLTTLPAAVVAWTEPEPAPDADLT